MNIQRLSSGSYRVLVRRTINGKKISKSATFPNKLQAQAWGANLEWSLVEAAGFTLHEAIDMYIKEKIDPKLLTLTTETGRDSHHKMINRHRNLQAKLKGYTLPSFTPLEAKRYRDKRLRSVKPETVRKELWAISGVYQWFRKEHCMSDLLNPIRFVGMPDTGEQRTTVHTLEEQEQMLNALKPEYRMLYRLLLETAMRLSEVTYMRVEWIHPEFLSVTLPQDITKAKKARRVPITDRAGELLKQAVGGRSKGRVFDVKYETFRQHFDRTKRKIGLGHIRLHDCRHTAMTRFASKINSIVKLRQISGHASLHMLGRYVHPEDEDIRREMNGC